MMYEARRAVRSRARIAFKAAVEPMLMSERRTQTMSEMMMALIGIADLGWICSMSELAIILYKEVKSLFAYVSNSC